MFHCSKSLLSSFDERVTTGTYNFAPFILKLAFVGLLISATAGSASGSAFLVAVLVNTQFSDQVRVKDTSQLINGMSIFFSKDYLIILMARQFQHHLFLHCYLLIFL